MHTAVKIQGKQVFAWTLGKNSEKEKQLIADGKIVMCADGSYELFSQEALSGHGEKARAGDWFKVDSKGFPYPLNASFFEKNHRHIEGDRFEQIPRPVNVWFCGDEIDDLIRFIMERKSMEINPDNPDAYFSAPLWGTILTAKKDAAVVIYSIKREENTITDIDFNFVEREEFEKTYRIL